MDPKLFIATKALIEHDGKILILREAGSYAEGTNTGRFDVPGGRLKAGENYLDALRREVREETGLDVEIGGPVAVGEWRPVVREEPWQIVGVFFHCRAATREVALSEDHDAFEWIDPTMYKDYNLIPNLTAVFEAYTKQPKTL